MLTPGTPEAWRAMCEGKWETDRTRPPCYDHPPFENKLQTGYYEPHIPWSTPWMKGCPHWKPGGNAHVTATNCGLKGVRLPWENCKGCIHKEAV